MKRKRKINGAKQKSLVLKGALHRISEWSVDGYVFGLLNENGHTSWITINEMKTVSQMQKFSSKKSEWKFLWDFRCCICFVVSFSGQKYIQREYVWIKYKCVTHFDIHEPFQKKERKRNKKAMKKQSQFSCDFQTIHYIVENV